MGRYSTWDSRKMRELIHKVAMKALHDGAEAILTESLKEVPHATGTLARSGIVVDWPSRGEVYVSYNTPYARYQHETQLRHPDPRNPLSTPGRKWKYLEDPFNRLKAKVMKLVRLRVKKALKGTK